MERRVVWGHRETRACQDCPDHRDPREHKEKAYVL